MAVAPPAPEVEVTVEFAGVGVMERVETEAVWMVEAFAVVESGVVVCQVVASVVAWTAVAA